jgi:ankyrin repeat protein
MAFSQMKLFDQLIDAARDGKLAEVERLIASDPTLITKTDSMGRTALFYAAVNDHMPVATFLVKQKADVCQIIKDSGRTLLMHVATDGHGMMAEFLIKQGALSQVNFAEKTNKKTALMCVATGDENAVEHYVDCAKVLLDHKAEINAQNKYGETALMLANTESKVFDQLLTTNPDLELKDKSGRTIFLRLCHKDDGREKSIDRIKQLITRKVNVNAVTDDGESALDLILGNTDEKTIKQKITILFSASNPAFDPVLKQKAYEKAVAEKANKKIKILASFSVKPGLELNIKLIISAYEAKEFNEVLRLINDMSEAKQLTSLSDATDNDGNTLIMRAIKDEKYDIAMKLVPLSNPNHRNKKNESPLELALNREQIPVAEQLMVRGADINGQTSRNESLLMHFMSKEEVALFLIAKGACVESTPDSKGDTPLIVAVRKIKEKIVKAILLKQPKNDINKKGSDDRTALFIAVYEGLGDSRYAKIVKELVAAGADPYVPCTLGSIEKMTVFDMSCFGSCHFGKLLKDYKAQLEKQKKPTSDNASTSLATHHATTFTVNGATTAMQAGAASAEQQDLKRKYSGSMG